MSTKRAAISGLVLTALAWIVWVSLSLWQAGDSLPELTQSGAPTVQMPAEADPAPDVSAELEEPATESIPTSAAVAAAPAAIETGNPGVATARRIVPELNAYMWVSTSLESRCRAFRITHYVPETFIHPDELRYLSPEEFKAVVDLRPFDGQLQRAYARSLRAAVRGPEPSNNYLPSPDDDATIRDYDLNAVRGRDWLTAHHLAAMYNYGVDKVEAYAWWRIAQDMGHYRGISPDSAGWRGWTPSDQEMREGAERADELINDFDLLPGLGVPEECLTPDQTVEEHTYLAALVRRLAQRALPSDASGSGARRFNRLNGHALVVEHVCSLNCSTDVRRVIYYQDIPDEDACDGIDGVQQTVETRLPTGRTEERTFCVPAFLAENP